MRFLALDIAADFRRSRLVSGYRDHATVHDGDRQQRSQTGDEPVSGSGVQVGQGCQQHLFVLRPELRQEFPVSQEKRPGIPHSGTTKVLRAVQTQQSVVQVSIPVEPKPQSVVLFKDLWLFCLGCSFARVFRTSVERKARERERERERERDREREREGIGSAISCY